MSEKRESVNVMCAIGFTEFEYLTIEMFFHLTQHSTHRWSLSKNPKEAKVILVNLSSQADVDTCRPFIAPHHRVLAVGSSSYNSGWPVIQRPMRLTAILHMLNAMSENAWAPTINNQPELTAKLNTAASPAKPLLSPGTASTVATGSANPITATRQTTLSQLSQVLVVDDSDVALRFMQSRLRLFGYEAELASSGEQALGKISTKQYKFVFLDVMMDGLDGYQVCKAIKQLRRAHPAPVVVMLTSRSGTIDKIRGAMSGCDAYLTKPLSDKALSEVLIKYDPDMRSVNPRKSATPVFQDTQPAAVGMKF